MRELDVSEALRYLGAGRNPGEELRAQVQHTARTLMRHVRPHWTWRAFELEREAAQKGKPASLFLRSSSGTGEAVLSGRTAESMLASCHGTVLLACTLGTAFDALLRAAQTRDMAEAVVLDACGSAWVETGCDEAEREISARFPDLYMTDRFSPGYGDLPLSLQRDICALLDTPRRLGVHVTDSLLLNPVKSVTAVIGISDRPQMARIRGCGYCSMREECAFRKSGKNCQIE